MDDVHGLGEGRLAEDIALAKALQDVSVPDGLERRLLAQVANLNAAAALRTAVVPGGDQRVAGRFVTAGGRGSR